MTVPVGRWLRVFSERKERRVHYCILAQTFSYRLYGNYFSVVATKLNLLLRNLSIDLQDALFAQSEKEYESNAACFA